MLDRILAQIALALFDVLAKRIEMGKVSMDSDIDRDRLIRAGRRIDEWLRKQNSTDIGGQSNQNRT